MLFEIYCDVVASGGAQPRGGGGAQPRGGVSTRQVFVEGWVRERAVYVARQDGKAVGGYFLQSNFPAFAAHIAQGGYLVARACRGSGIGTELLITRSMKRIAWAIQRRCRKIHKRDIGDATARAMKILQCDAYPTPGNRTDGQTGRPRRAERMRS